MISLFDNWIKLPFESNPIYRDGYGMTVNLPVEVPFGKHWFHFRMIFSPLNVFFTFCHYYILTFSLKLNKPFALCTAISFSSIKTIKYYYN